MQQQTNRVTHKRYRGFSIVEIVVVIAVMGILASISVVGYGTWRQRTAESEVKSDLNGAKTAMENARNNNNGYPQAVPFQTSENVDIAGGGESDGKTFCITASSKRYPQIKYYISNTNASAQTGSCPLTPSTPQYNTFDGGGYVSTSGQQLEAYWKAPLKVGSGITGYKVRIDFGATCAGNSNIREFGLVDQNTPPVYFNDIDPNEKTYGVYYSDVGPCGQASDIVGVYVSARNSEGYGPEFKIPVIYN